MHVASSCNLVDTLAPAEIIPTTLSLITSSAFFPFDTDRANDAEKAQFAQESIIPEFLTGSEDQVTEEQNARGQPYIRVRLGSRFYDVRDANYFTSTFIKVLPYGLGGPVPINKDQKNELKEFDEKPFGLQT